MAGLIAVHVGAGYHTENRWPVYKKLCKKACSEAAILLNQNGSAIEAVSQAVSCLEDSPLTNAGIGSNLTIDGKIECDAILMDGNSLNFGSVGALCNIQNPIFVCKKILDNQNKGLMPCGLIPPCTVVGDGASKWAKEHGFPPVAFGKLSTIASRKSYLKNMSLLRSTGSSVPSDPKLLEGRSYNENTLLDTVGAVCVDKMGNVSAALSSGGLLLKHSGRIGQASLYGSGCWAQNSSISSKPSIAISASGVGEYLIKTLFAKECYQALYENRDNFNSLPIVFQEKFLNSPYLKHIESKPAGILILSHNDPEKYCDISWTHSTETMVLGCMNTLDRKPYSWVSKLPEGSVYGKSVFASEKHFKL